MPYDDEFCLVHGHTMKYDPKQGGDYCTECVKEKQPSPEPTPAEPPTCICDCGEGPTGIHAGGFEKDCPVHGDTVYRDLEDALAFLRIVLTRKTVVQLECLKPKILDWMKRKGREPSILRGDE